MPVMHGEGHHHNIHWRHEWKFEKYIRHILARLLGHNDHQALKKCFDRSICVVGMISPIMTIPQVWQVWENQSTDGLVSISWITYLVVSCFWLMYGILHHEKPIILINSCWVLVNAAMVIGIYLFS